MLFSKRMRSTIFSSVTGIIFLLLSQVSYAIVIGPNTIINTDTTYSNTTLDMTNGSFIIKNNAVLTIENSTITGDLSLIHPTLFDVQLGTLKLLSNTVNISANTIAPHPNTQSLTYVMRLEQAKLELNSNVITIDKPFASGLLITSASIATDHIDIRHNRINNFHGAFYLLNSSSSIINDNILKLNSYGNIVLVGNDSHISDNFIYFAGRDELGNAMDILNSTQVVIDRNVIFTPTCHGIYVVASENVAISDNSITGGISHAMNLLSHVNPLDKDSYAVKILGERKLLPILTKNIMVTNNVMSQNRYGIAVTDVDNIVITGNFFSQRFKNATNRKFWTNNNVLMKNVTSLTWTNNLYKEAFSQDRDGDNSMTRIVIFPETGGVTL